MFNFEIGGAQPLRIIPVTYWKGKTKLFTTERGRREEDLILHDLDFFFKKKEVIALFFALCISKAIAWIIRCVPINKSSTDSIRKKKYSMVY